MIAVINNLTAVIKKLTAIIKKLTAIIKKWFSVKFDSCHMSKPGNIDSFFNNSTKKTPRNLKFWSLNKGFPHFLPTLLDIITFSYFTLFLLILFLALMLLHNPSFYSTFIAFNLTILSNRNPENTRDIETAWYVDCYKFSEGYMLVDWTLGLLVMSFLFLLVFLEQVGL